MKKMVSLLVVGALALGGATVVRAEGKAMSAGSPATSVDQVKSKKIEELDQKIKMLQDDKSCISAAKDKMELKKCRETVKAAMTKMRDEKKAKREAMKAKKDEMKAMKTS